MSSLRTTTCDALIVPSGFVHDFNSENSNGRRTRTPFIVCVKSFIDYG